MLNVFRSSFDSWIFNVSNFFEIPPKMIPRHPQTIPDQSHNFRIFQHLWSYRCYFLYVWVILVLFLLFWMRGGRFLATCFMVHFLIPWGLQGTPRLIQKGANRSFRVQNQWDMQMKFAPFWINFASSCNLVSQVNPRGPQVPICQWILIHFSNFPINFW